MSRAETPTTITFYSEAGFWGDQLQLEAYPTGANEGYVSIAKADLERARLLSRISSVRLRCGSRDSEIMLHTERNPRNLAFWSAFGTGYPISCTAGNITPVNLHSEAPKLADRVGSAFLVVHALNPKGIAFSDFVVNNWDQEFRKNLPDGAKALGGAQLKLTTPGRFDLRQDLKVDDWRCGGRKGHFVLHAQLDQSPPPGEKYFSVSVGEVYLDTGWGDAWGCREGMRNAVRGGANKAAAQIRGASTRLHGRSSVNDRATILYPLMAWPSFSSMGAEKGGPASRPRETTRR